VTGGLPWCREKATGYRYLSAETPAELRADEAENAAKLGYLGLVVLATGLTSTRFPGSRHGLLTSCAASEPRRYAEFINASHACAHFMASLYECFSDGRVWYT